MNSVMLYKKMCHEFQNKLDRELTVKEHDFIKWIVIKSLKKQTVREISHSLVGTNIQYFH